MVLKISLLLVLLVMCSCDVEAIFGNNNQNRHNKNDSSSLATIKMSDHPSLNTVSSSVNTNFNFSNSEKFGHSGVTTSGEHTTQTTPHKQLGKLNLKCRAVTVVKKMPIQKNL
ncbi:hypothetical protein K1719_003685 [Acacia pycnantha]|nr:hypothetical protein K1719_003685 [Acacia pycnantha]